MSTFTTAKGLEQVARGGDLGTWDTPTNSNLGIIDAALGQVATIPLNNSNVVLSSPQFQCNLITFNSTLTGSVTITFPTSFTGFYSIQHLCTGSSVFTITLQTTVAGGQVIGALPGEVIDVFNDGTNIKYRNLGRVGSYMDFALSSTPNWVSACTVPPYLNCDGTTFSSAIFPQLAVALGGNTLPNSMGKYRLTLNQSASTPISTSNGALFTASSVGVVGGTQAITLATSQIPIHTHGITDPGHTHPNTTPVSIAQANAPPGGFCYGSFTNSGAATTGILINNAGGGGAFTALPPSYVGGLTMIRSA